MNTTTTTLEEMSYKEMTDVFFTVLGICVSGLVAGFTMVGVFIYKPEVEKPYREKYHDEFEDMEERDMSVDEIKGLSEKYLEEETPKGVVKMCYDNESECFKYWCEDKSISYMILDAVAQKYAIENDCKAICIDYKEEFYKAIDRVNKHNKEKEEKKKKENEDDKKEDEDDDKNKRNVFAKFKSYNTVNKKQVSDDKEKQSIQVDKCNKFRYKGKLSEFDEMKVNKKKEESNDNEKLSMADWLRNRKEKSQDESKEVNEEVSPESSNDDDKKEK